MTSTIIVRPDCSSWAFWHRAFGLVRIVVLIVIVVVIVVFIVIAVATVKVFHIKIASFLYNVEGSIRLERCVIIVIIVIPIVVRGQRLKKILSKIFFPLQDFSLSLIDWMS